MLYLKQWYLSKQIGREEQGKKHMDYTTITQSSQKLNL